MKKRFLVLTLLLSMLMVLSSVSSVFATIDPDNAYGYTITVYSGRHGHFSDGSTVKTIKAKAGEPINIDFAVELNDNEEDSQYYVRGFRETGHDNDEQMAMPAFDADEDVSYEVAYGIKGGMVKYTVMYVDADGNSLDDSREFYGMVGDKPVVSYRYVEGYQPEAYNLTKTLVADESKNIFSFSYKANPEGGAEGDNGATGQAGARNAANGQNANANAGANAANADANANDNTPATIVDLDDNATPQAETAGGGATDVAETDTPKAGISPIAIGGGVAALAAIAAAAAVIIRRRSEYEDDDDEDDETDAQSSNKHVYAQE